MVIPPLRKNFFKGAESALPQHFRVSKSPALIGLNCLRVCMQFNNTFHRYQLKTLYIGWGFQLMFFMQKWTILFPKSFWNNVESLFFILVTRIRFESSPSLLKITKRIGTRKIKKKRFEPITKRRLTCCQDGCFCIERVLPPSSGDRTSPLSPERRRCRVRSFTGRTDPAFA